MMAQQYCRVITDLLECDKGNTSSNPKPDLSLLARKHQINRGWDSSEMSKLLDAKPEEDGQEEDDDQSGTLSFAAFDPTAQVEERI